MSPGAAQPSPIGSLVGRARAVHATRSASRLLPRRGADPDLRRPHPGKCPEPVHAAVDLLFRRGRGLHLHLGVHGGVGLRPAARSARAPLYATRPGLRRAWQLYVAHIFLFVLFIAEVSYTAAKVKNPMYNEEMRVADFLEEPHIAVVKALLLQFQPAFLDILPMYILMLAIFPVGAARRCGGTGCWCWCRRLLVYAACSSHLGAGLSGRACLVFQPARLAVPVRRGRGAGLFAGPGRRVAALALAGALSDRRGAVRGSVYRQGQLDDPRLLGPLPGAVAEGVVAGQQDQPVAGAAHPVLRAGRWSSPPWCRRPAVSPRGGRGRWCCAASSRWRSSASASCCRRSAISSFRNTTRRSLFSSRLILRALSQCALRRGDRLVQNHGSSADAAAARGPRRGDVRHMTGAD